MAKKTDFFTTLEASRLLQLSLNTLYSLIRQGDFPKPLAKGIHSRPAVEQWKADRLALVPFPSGRSLQSYSRQVATGGNCLTTCQAAIMARCSEPQLYLWIRRGDFPKPISRGLHSRAAVEQWCADRIAGKRLPFSGGLPAVWSQVDKSATYSMYDLPKLTRYSAVSIYKLVKRGDFPKPVARGHYLKKDVDKWVSDRKAGFVLPGSRLASQHWSAEAAPRHVEPLTQLQIYGMVARSRWSKIRDIYVNMTPPQPPPEYTEWRKIYDARDYPEDHKLIDTMLAENGYDKRLTPKDDPTLPTVGPDGEELDESSDFEMDADGRVDEKYLDIDNTDNDDDSSITGMHDDFGLDEID